jgi:hypothetical protein
MNLFNNIYLGIKERYTTNTDKKEDLINKEMATWSYLEDEKIQIRAKNYLAQKTILYNRYKEANIIHALHFIVATLIVFPITLSLVGIFFPIPYLASCLIGLTIFYQQKKFYSFFIKKRQAVAHAIETIEEYLYAKRITTQSNQHERESEEKLELIASQREFASHFTALNNIGAINLNQRKSYLGEKIVEYVKYACPDKLPMNSRKFAENLKDSNKGIVPIKPQRDIQERIFEKSKFKGKIPLYIQPEHLYMILNSEGIYKEDSSEILEEFIYSTFDYRCTKREKLEIIVQRCNNWKGLNKK